MGTLGLKTTINVVITLTTVTTVWAAGQVFSKSEIIRIHHAKTPPAFKLKRSLCAKQYRVDSDGPRAVTAGGRPARPSPLRPAGVRIVTGWSILMGWQPSEEENGKNIVFISKSRVYFLVWIMVITERLTKFLCLLRTLLPGKLMLDSADNAFYLMKEEKHTTDIYGH